MRANCGMTIGDERINCFTPTMRLDISVEDFMTICEMYELITNNYYHSDICFSDENGKVRVGCLKDQIKEE